MFRFLPLLAITLCATLVHSAETSFRLQTESELTLSISQEAEEAIDRAQRWLKANSTASNRVDTLLQNYALANPGGEPFVLYRCDIPHLNTRCRNPNHSALSPISPLSLRPNAPR